VSHRDQTHIPTSLFQSVIQCRGNFEKTKEMKPHKSYPTALGADIQSLGRLYTLYVPALQNAIATRVLLPNHLFKMVAPCLGHGEALLYPARLGNIRTIASGGRVHPIVYNLFISFPVSDWECIHCGSAAYTEGGSPKVGIPSQRLLTRF
jgi:hypothetical protein